MVAEQELGIRYSKTIKRPFETTDNCTVEYDRHTQNKKLDLISCFLLFVVQDRCGTFLGFVLRLLTISYSDLGRANKQENTLGKYMLQQIEINRCKYHQ